MKTNLVTALCLLSFGWLISDDPLVAQELPSPETGVISLDEVGPDKESDSTQSGVITLDEFPDVPRLANPRQSLVRDAEGRQSPQQVQQASFINRIFGGPPPRVFGTQVAEPFGPLGRLERRSGKGPGYDANNTNVNIFVPIHDDPGKSLFFWNLRTAMDDNYDWFANFGWGYRYYHEELNRVHGLSLWLDFDDHQESYLRAGLSGESVGQFIDYRFNFYLLMFGDHHTLNNVIVGDPVFSGNNILFNHQRTVESAYSGGDVEMGGALPYLGRYGVKGFAGLHFMDADTDSAFGWNARLETEITEDIVFNIRHSDNDSFGSTTSLGIAITFPTFLPSKIFRAKEVRKRLGDPVERQYRIPTRIDTIAETSVAINPADNAAFFVLHTDPDAATNGDGTFENPFNTFENMRVGNAANADILFVQSRADNTGTNLATTAPFQLFDNQRLLGEGIQHQFTSTTGTFNLPGFVLGANSPMVSNSTNGNVIQLANANEVAGMTVIGSTTGNGIAGTGILGTNLNNNTVQGGVNGILILNSAGLIANNQAAIIANNTLTGNVNDGVLVNNTNTGQLDLSLTGNTSANNGPTVNGSGYSLIANNSIINASDTTTTPQLGILNNGASGNGTGFTGIASNGGTININAEGNNFNTNVTTTTGANFTASNGGTININSFRNNNVLNNVGSGVIFQSGLATDTIGGSTVNVDNFGGNTITGNQLAGVSLVTDFAGATMNVTLGDSGETANNISGNTTGVRIVNNGGIFQSATGTGPAIISNNQIGQVGNGNGSFGILLVNNGGTFDMTIGGATAADGNILNSNGIGLESVFNDIAGTGTAPSFTFQNNTIQNSTNRGASIATNNAVMLTATVANNAIITNGTAGGAGGGLTLQSNNTSNSTFNVNDNNISNNIGNNTGNTNFFDTVDNADGVTVIALNGATSAFNIGPNNTLNGNTGSGVGIYTDDFSAPTINVSGSTIDSNQLDGVRAQIESFSSPTINIGLAGQPNVITNNLQNGVNIQQGTTTSQEFNNTNATISILGNTITNNQAGGINYDIFGSTGGGFFPSVAFTNTTIQGNNLFNPNALFGIRINTSGRVGTRGTTGSFNIIGNIIDTHNGDGIVTIADANFRQDRTFFRANGPTVGTPPMDSTPLPIQPDGGTFLGAADYRQNYLNLDTDQNLAFVITGNTIQNNTDNGLDQSVSTNAYVSADVQNNAFSNNTNGDFVTSSFLANGNTPNSTNRQGLGTFDEIVLDDTAQYNLRFEGNIGNIILPSALGATYTNNDPGKNFDGAGGFDQSNRSAYLFAVENGNTLTSSNNFGFAAGGIQDIESAFLGGSYFVFPFANPAFPDPGFPNNLPFLGGFNNLPGLP